ncbi:MAG: hypothetical protein CSB24_02115 [Deltaproteobacteria bacterium]|nr:MAG: hypothetical protein CSB24_02115 [Deltaproteobacteria bacterium]
MGGCGYKDMPVPPDEVVPEPVDDLSYEVDETGINLTWSFPAKNINGDALENIASFKLYRAVVALEDYCPTCPVPFGEPIKVPGGLIEGENGSVRKAEYRSTLLRPGHRYFFKVHSSTSWWAESADSNIVSFVWQVPAKAPAGLTAVVNDRAVKLAWQPVSSLVNGEKISGDLKYQVSRSADGNKFTSLGSPVGKTFFADNTVFNGKRYFYKVQSVVYIDGDKLKGGTSKAVEAEPADQTPPPMITGVAVIRAGKNIKIVWNASTAKDVAFYRIYRKVSGQNKPVRIGEAKSIYNIFVDKNVSDNKRFYYSVTAVDGNGNESRRSAEMTTRD